MKMHVYAGGIFGRTYILNRVTESMELFPFKVDRRKGPMSCKVNWKKNIFIKCWFLTAFKYLQIMRKWYSNSLSFLLLLLEQVPFVRRRGNNSYEKVYTRIIIESNWQYAKSLLSIVRVWTIFSGLTEEIHIVYVSILSWRWMCNHRKQMNTINLLCMLICYHVHHTILQVWS
jgi:hypothetical protein